MSRICPQSFMIHLRNSATPEVMQLQVLQEVRKMRHSA
jgi:hypothetical protein